MLVCPFVVFHKTEIKQGERVDELIQRASFLLAEAGISAYETAQFQVVEAFGEGAAARFPDDFLHFGACHPDFFLAQGLHDGQIRLRVLEKRGIQVVEFAFQFAVGAETQPVDVLREAVFAVEQAPIIRHAAQDHISLRDFLSRHIQASDFGIMLTFSKIERGEVDALGEAVV